MIGTIRAVSYPTRAPASGPSINEIYGHWHNRHSARTEPRWMGAYRKGARHVLMSLYACTATWPGEAVFSGWPLSGIRGIQEVRWTSEGGTVRGPASLWRTKKWNSCAPTLALSILGGPLAQNDQSRVGGAFGGSEGSRYSDGYALTGWRTTNTVLFIPERISRFGTGGGRNGEE